MTRTEQDIIREHLSKAGKKGGDVTRLRFSDEHFKEIGRKGHAKRMENVLKKWLTK